MRHLPRRARQPLRRPCRPVHPDAHQRDADHQDDSARHHRREQGQQAAEERRDQDRHDAGDDGRAEDACRPKVRVRRHSCHRPHGGEGDAHHDRHPNTNHAEEAERLDQRRDAGREQVGVDQQRHLLGRQLERAADDQRHGDRAGVHDEPVLQPDETPYLYFVSRNDDFLGGNGDSKDLYLVKTGAFRVGQWPMAHGRAV